MRRRALADADNRGKLSLPEFYVAMGLIYRSKWYASSSLFIYSRLARVERQ